MNDTEILEDIAEVARRHLDHDGPLVPEMRLIEDLELDSIRRLTLAIEVENHFRVCLDEADDVNVETVGDLVAAVARKLAADGRDEVAAEPAVADAAPSGDPA